MSRDRDDVHRLDSEPAGRLTDLLRQHAEAPDFSLTKDEARRVANNIAKLPDLLAPKSWVVSQFEILGCVEWTGMGHTRRTGQAAPSRT